MCYLLLVKYHTNNNSNKTQHVAPLALWKKSESRTVTTLAFFILFGSFSWLKCVLGEMKAKVKRGSEEDFFGILYIKDERYGEWKDVENAICLHSFIFWPIK